VRATPVAALRRAVEAAQVAVLRRAVEAASVVIRRRAVEAAPVVVLRRAVEVATAAAHRLVVDPAPVAIVRFVADAEPASVLRLLWMQRQAVVLLLSPLPPIHGPGEQAMGDRWPGCASVVLWKRIAERAPASPASTSQRKGASFPSTEKEGRPEPIGRGVATVTLA
jgi:hypothetical protein